jgi:hypothetical protein
VTRARHPGAGVTSVAVVLTAETCSQSDGEVSKTAWLS